MNTSDNIDTYNPDNSRNLDKLHMVSPGNPKESSVENSDSYNMGLSKYILFSTFVAALSSFNAGWNTGVTNIPNDTIRGTSGDKPLLNQCYAGSSFPVCLYTRSDILWGFAIGLFALGGCVGSLIAGKINDILGRKRSLLIGNVPFILGALLLATSTTISQFAIGRFMVGMGSGAASVLVSTYIGEIATVKRRGTLGTILQLMMVIGILASNVIGYALNYTPGWRILLALAAVPAILQAFVLPILKETPKYLVFKGDNDAALKSLESLRKGYDVVKELGDITQEQEKNASIQTVSVLQVFNESQYIKSILVILVIHAVQQFSGINGIIAYSSTYFNAVIGQEFSSLTTICISILNLISTLVGVYLIDKSGRKPLLLFSCLGISLSSLMVVIGSIYEMKVLIVVFVMVFIISFAVGLGPIPWLLMSEMFPTRILSAVTSLSICINWLCNFIITMTFPYLNTALNNYTFLIFSVICAAAFVFIMMLLPETKGSRV